MRRLWVLVLTALFLAPSLARASTSEVGVKDFAFDPKNETVAVGGSVHWSRESGSSAAHSVTANNGFWDSGAPTSGSIDLTATFSAGTFRYYCKVHGAPNGAGLYGMIGFVKVPGSITAGPSGPPFRVRWAGTSTDTGNTFDVQYRVGSGAWHAWKTGTSSLSAVFGKDGKPKVAKRGTTYSFRARSIDGAGPSGWSPKASFTP